MLKLWLYDKNKVHKIYGKKGLEQGGVTMQKDEMRDRLVELLENICEKYAPCEMDTVADHLIANGVTIADGDKMPSTGWIPVTERLPENDTVVLVYRPSMTKQVRTSYYFKGFHEGQFDIHGNEVITHWAYIPEPPKGE